MNITIDIGNSKTKVTAFKNNKLFKVDSYSNNLNFNTIFTSNNIQKINSIIVCSVHNEIPDNILLLKKTCNNFIVFSHKTKIPVKNLYSTPETLGLDRLAASVGAYSIFPNKNSLIIDAGTAITFDIINFKGEYMGGSISPGILTRYKALSYYTKKLPDLEFNENYEYPAGSTKSSIHAGIQLGIIYETEGYIDKLKKQFKNLNVVVTGGDINFFVKNIKKTIFAQPNLVAIGLNKIIKFNENKI